MIRDNTTSGAMLRTGEAPTLPEDAWFVPSSVSYDLGELQSYHIGEISTSQVLRVLHPSTAIRLTDFGAYRARQDWVSVENLPVVATVQDVLELLSADDLDLIDFACIVGGCFTVGSHDDGEVTLRAPPPFALRPFVHAALARRGFDAKVVLDAAEAHAGCYLWIKPPDEIFGVYATFDDYLKACGVL